MIAGLVFAALVFSLFFAIGAAAVCSAVLVWRRPPFWGGYIMAKAGILTTAAIILGVLVLPAGAVALTWPTWVFLVGVLGESVGTVAITRDVLRRTGRREGFSHGLR